MVGFPSLSAVATALLASAFVVAQDPNYQVPFAKGTGDWAESYKKAKTLVSTLTLEEKLNLTISMPGGIPRIGYIGPVWCDGPNGGRGFSGHSAVPAALHAAATFDRQLVYDRAAIMGKEAYGAGCHTLTGPMINILRSPEAGRSFEGFGADPYLMGQFGVQSTKGIQDQDVAAQAKHYTIYNQEHARMFESNQVDDRAFREIYLPGFEETIRAGVGAIMCSYNSINGTQACENQHTLGDVLKGELDFQGYVISDYDALNGTAKPFNAGTDQLMGLTEYRFIGVDGMTYEDGEGLGKDLLPWINNGTVSLARVDDAATRVLANVYQFNLNNTGRPDSVTQFWEFETTTGFTNVQADHRFKIREIGAAGTVLLKNKGGALPLQKPAALGVFGVDAGPDRFGVNSAGFGVSGNGTVAMGYGSGWVEFPYLISPLEAINARARADNTWVQATTDNYNLAVVDSIAARVYNTACLVFINSQSGEEVGCIEDNCGDRNNLTAWHQGDVLVERVASQCSNTIVVAHSPGALLMPWADHENISAIVWAGLPGQESGNALVDVLYGDVNPSGRLPYTIAKEQADYSATVSYFNRTWVGHLQNIEYTESYYVDYRHFQAKGIEPLYAFGFGLSYTEFAYSGLKVNAASKRYRRTAKKTASSAAATPYPEELYDTLYTVSATVKNTGKLDGHEVSQLYVRLSAEADAPFKQLKGFERTWLKAGKSATVTFELRKRDVVYWSVEKQQWVVPESVEVYVGASSDDLRLSKKVTL